MKRAVNQSPSQKAAPEVCQLIPLEPTTLAQVKRTGEADGTYDTVRRAPRARLRHARRALHKHHAAEGRYFMAGDVRVPLANARALLVPHLEK